MKTQKKSKPVKENTTEILPFAAYDLIIVAFSGGKDSLACLLRLLEDGCPKDKIELWHHHIDGAPGSESFMDWPVTEAYVRAIGAAFGIKVRFQWREGGSRDELLKKDARSKRVGFELSDGSIGYAGGVKSKIATRMMFPMPTADLMIRWCSSLLKIQVFSLALNNDPELKNSKVLLLTGERRAESTSRSRYAEFEKHRSTTKNRRVDTWRAVIDWSEDQVWEIIERFKVNPHPAYRLGWGRVSCMTCIFGNANQWASVKAIAPETFSEMSRLEVLFGKTIHRSKSVDVQAAAGTAFAECSDEATRVEALGKTFSAADVFVDQWTRPAGAGSICGGPI